MTISARLITSVPHSKQAAFARLADSRGVSASKLMALLVDAALTQNPMDAGQVSKGRAASKASKEMPAQKYTVRLSGSDAAALEVRADGRQMTASTYAGHVLLAHLRAAPPMPYTEFAALKRVVAELGGIRAGLNAIEAGQVHKGALNDVLGDVVQRLLPALKTIREDVQSALEANSRSWEVLDA